MLTFEQLVAFRAVVRAGGFARAADELFLTQSAVSQRIRLLEQALGVKLFRRSGPGHSAELTEAGEQALKFADELTVRLARLHDEIKRAERGEHRETVTIVCSPAPAKYVLPALLTSYHEQYPDVQVKVVHCIGSDIDAHVRRGEADLGVQVGLFLDRRFHVIPLVSTRLVLIAAPDHPILDSPAEWLVRMGRCPFVAQPPNSAGRWAIQEWTAELGIEADIVLETNNVDLVKEAVMNRIGLAVLSEVAAIAEVTDGRLSVVPAPGMPRQWDFFLIADPKRTCPPAGQALLDIASLEEWRKHLPILAAPGTAALALSVLG